MFNKKAADLILRARKQRRLTLQETDKVIQFAKKNGNNALMKKTGSGYASCRYAGDRERISVGDWACSGVGDGASYVWFDRDDTCAGRGSLDPGVFSAVWSVSENEA